MVVAAWKAHFQPWPGPESDFCLLVRLAVILKLWLPVAANLSPGNIQPQGMPCGVAFYGPDQAFLNAREHMTPFTVDANLCRKDGICAKVCPIQIIDGKVGELPTMAQHKVKVCIGCGQCMAFCPANACSAPGLSSQDSQPLNPQNMPTPEQAEELVFSRRSVRTFRNKPVPRETLTRLLDATRFAPTAKNTQQLRWIVLESREKTEALAKQIVDWLRKLAEIDPANAKAVHAESLVRTWDAGYDVICRHAPQLALIVAPKGHWGAADGAIAAAYLELIANAHKVGCCWGGYVCFALAHPAAHELRAFAGVQENEQVYAAQMMGYPRLAPHFRPPRKELDVTWL